MAVGYDINAAYPQLVREHMPNVDIVHDLFHVVPLLSIGVLKEAMQKHGRDRQEPVKQSPQRGEGPTQDPPLRRVSQNHSPRRS